MKHEPASIFIADDKIQAFTLTQEGLKPRGWYEKLMSTGYKDKYAVDQVTMLWHEQLRMKREKVPAIPKAYDLFKDPGSWCQNAIKEYDEVYGWRHCLIGIIMEKYNLDDYCGYHPDYKRDINRVAACIMSRDAAARYNSMCNDSEAIIARWNDTLGRTHAEVLEILRETNV